MIQGEMFGTLPMKCRGCNLAAPRWGEGEVVVVHGREGFVVEVVTDDHGACVHDPFLVVHVVCTGTVAGYWPEELTRYRVDPIAAMLEELP